MARRGRRLLRSGSEAGLDRMKYEIARELGLDDDIQQRGWENMTTREVGKIGGNMVKRMVEYAESHVDDLTQSEDGLAAGRAPEEL